MSSLLLPQGRIPLGFATINGQKVSVEIDQQWMRWATTLTERAGGIVGPNNIVNYISSTVAPSVVLDSGGDDSEDQILVINNITTTSGGASATYGTATIDFGAGANEASVAVAGQASILATSKASAFVMADDTSSGHTANDHKYFGALATLSCGTPTLATGFTIYARSPHKLTGTWTVRWSWAD